MTPTEVYLYGMTRFKIEDDVMICGELAGTVTGIKVTTSGEDQYRVFFFDAAGTPREEWYRASLLDEPDDDDSNSNVICFACAKQAREATRH